MKILFAVRALFPDIVGGSARHSYFLIKHLAKQDIRIHVLHPSTNAHFDEFNNVHEQYVPYGRNAYEYARNINSYLRDAKIGYDIGYSDGFSLWKYLDDRSFPCIYMQHGYHMFQTDYLKAYFRYHPARATIRFWKDALRRRIVKYHVQNSDYVISLGGHITTNILQSKLEVDSTKILEIPNAVDLTYIDNKIAPNQEKIKNSLLFVGGLKYRKGLTYLVKALNGVDLPNVKLFLVGKGNMQDDLKKLNSNAEIQFCGHLSEEDLFDLYSKVECFVLPTLCDGMPTVILEAMACSLPIIATDTGAVKTMVRPKNGFVVPQKDVQALKRTIEIFFTQPKTDKKMMSRKSRRIVEKEFTWDIVSGKFYDRVKSLC